MDERNRLAALAIYDILGRSPEEGFDDIDMSRGMDALRRAAAIRDRWPPIEIILTSGHFDAGNIRMPPHSVFFPKPYVVEKVVETLWRMAG